MLMPPKLPSPPAMTATTGASGRSSSTPEQASATAASPRFASCSRTPPVSSSRTADGGDARTGVADRQAERRGDLRAGHLADPSALERLLDADHDRPGAGHGAADDDEAVVRLGNDALPLEPGRLDVVERPDQFRRGPVVEQRERARPCVALDEAVAAQVAGDVRDERVHLGLGRHARSSPAVSSVD